MRFPLLALVALASAGVPAEPRKTVTEPAKEPKAPTPAPLPPLLGDGPTFSSRPSSNPIRNDLAAQCKQRGLRIQARIRRRGWN